MRYPVAVLSVSLTVSSASIADADTRADVRVIVLRTNAPDAPLAERVDRALVASLSADAGFGRAELSPIPLSDLGLAVGCNDRSRHCLNRIASTVDADVVVLRDLHVEDEEPILSLTSFDSLGAGAPIYLERPIENELDEEVSQMVRELYALDAEESEEIMVLDTTRVSYSRHGRAGDDDADRAVGPATWVALGLGVAAIGAGAILGALSDEALEAYARTPIRSEPQADRARAQLETAQDRALAANVLFGAGGGLLALGATLLAIDLSEADEGPRLSVSAAAVRSGGVIAVGGHMEAL